MLITANDLPSYNNIVIYLNGCDVTNMAYMACLPDEPKIEGNGYIGYYVINPSHTRLGAGNQVKDENGFPFFVYLHGKTRWECKE
jgi:hypothetical protein